MVWCFGALGYFTLGWVFGVGDDWVCVCVGIFWIVVGLGSLSGFLLFGLGLLPLGVSCFVCSWNCVFSYLWCSLCFCGFSGFGFSGLSTAWFRRFVVGLV